MNKIIQSCSFLVLVNFMAFNVFAENNEASLQLGSVTSGIVKKIHVQINQKVKQGDLLLEFDDTLANGNVAEAKAMLQLTQINLLEAKKELTRSEELFERTVLSEHELQSSKILYFKALAQHSSAKNKLIHAQWEQKEHKVLAPFEAEITKIYCYPGQYINSTYTTQTLFTLQKSL